MTVRLNPPLPGLSFTRCVAAMHMARTLGVEVVRLAERKWPDTPSVASVLKTGVGAGTPYDGNFGEPLYQTGIAEDFLLAVRAASIPDRIGARPFPFVLNVPKETTAGSAGYWVGSGAPHPVAAAALDTLSLPRHHVGAMFVLDDELLRLASPAHEAALRNILVAGFAAYLSQQFVDPRVAAVTDVSPASISNGATEITSAGATAATINADFQNMVAAVSSELTSPFWIMRRKDATHLAGLHHANGGQQFPGAPREILGIPVLTSSAVPADAGSPPTDRYVLLLDGSQVALADDGRVEVSVSKVTTVQMDSAPTNDSATPTPANMTSMFQTNSAAVKITRFMSWARTYDNCCAWMRVSW